MFDFLRYSFHFTRVGFRLAREGVFLLIPKKEIPTLIRPLFAFLSIFARKNVIGENRIARALQKLGPSYVKLGQLLATRPDIIGFPLAKELEILQDQMLPFPQDEAIKIVESALNKPIDSLFYSFGPAVAAASIAQVHKGEIIEDGALRAVAVKILRPNIDEMFLEDIRAQYYFAGLTEKFIPSTRRLKLKGVIETLERSVRLELDLRFEAAALSEIAENTKKDEGFCVPKVDWERTSKTCLTMEWIDGIKFNDSKALDDGLIDRQKLARLTMQSFLRHALRDGFFHADMHPGNLFALHNGTLAAVDFGITGRLGHKERRFLAEILYGFIIRDYKRVAEVHFEAGYVSLPYKIEDFAQALRAVGEKIHGKSSAEISMAHLLGLLFEITALFEMETRIELVLLQKNMVIVEGVARGLDPKFHMWNVAEPVLKEWIENNLGICGKTSEAVHDLQNLWESLKKIPYLIRTAEKLMQELNNNKKR